MFLSNNMTDFRSNYSQNVRNMQLQIVELQTMNDVLEIQNKSLQKEKHKEQTKALKYKMKNEELMDKMKFIQNADKLKEQSLNYFQRKYNNVDIDKLHSRIRELECDIDVKEGEIQGGKIHQYQIKSELSKVIKRYSYLITRFEEYVDQKDSFMVDELQEMKIESIQLSKKLKDGKFTTTKKSNNNVIESPLFIEKKGGTEV